MQREAMLTQLGYVPNDALLKQLQRIEENTTGYEKIQKHIMDLHDHLKIDDAYVAMSNSNDFFKIKIESQSPEIEEEAHEKIRHFSEKFKVAINKLENKNTYYIVGFNH
ncbi:MAG: hypothetical protein A2513_01820 [Sulfurimonas sp. RIFOXYD12_FULL_33_39]|uniref:hypothetical protein n=1 Tax=unclassified Sulfurimonas TaxID=2623549 RepID=UPI0008B597F0|nr:MULTISPECIES: hypothetical protein [unclassified Sulfurimonas]OHE07556.1 MAG: hypothetical protein A3G74_07295 [Sulfurimonas sp. RIFCSPLOWO2_12_FULL_34_6]OHE08732.1 MAG: hypothetical protein A2513_01820 [Sulfurimonas sp. RIFOXYD12_FULL_33_39]OHE14017.1 MAG: hypothetical protein A2530_03145 [Sulfurimonas sp. RIFOXYD2_FULL_34_21]DAB28457.1 MAG TPA: hypothetical protein CFH78_02365 [Sulfurimonas sp. UBA10385]